MICWGGVGGIQNNIKTIVSGPDKGIYDAMNKGIELSSGDVVGILNSDDIYESNKVLSLVNDAFTINVDAVYGDIEYVDRYEFSEQSNIHCQQTYFFDMHVETTVIILLVICTITTIICHIQHHHDHQIQHP